MKGKKSLSFTNFYWHHPFIESEIDNSVGALLYRKSMYFFLLLWFGLGACIQAQHDFDAYVTLTVD